jgi:hypothetical protein
MKGASDALLIEVSVQVFGQFLTGQIEAFHHFID